MTLVTRGTRHPSQAKDSLLECPRRHLRTNVRAPLVWLRWLGIYSQRKGHSLHVLGLWVQSLLGVSIRGSQPLFLPHITVSHPLFSLPSPLAKNI